MQNKKTVSRTIRPNWKPQNTTNIGSQHNHTLSSFLLSRKACMNNDTFHTMHTCGLLTISSQTSSCGISSSSSSSSEDPPVPRTAVRGRPDGAVLGLAPPLTLRPCSSSSSCCWRRASDRILRDSLLSTYCAARESCQVRRNMVWQKKVWIQITNGYEVCSYLNRKNNSDVS